MLESLRQLTLLESPSLEKEPADRCCNHLADEWMLRGATVQILKQRHRGDHLRISWSPDTLRTSSQLLVLGHYDTVYPSRTLAHMPFRVAGNKAFGPGTFDMKAGIVQALYALEALQQANVCHSASALFSFGLPMKKSAVSLRVRFSKRKPSAATLFLCSSLRSVRGAWSRLPAKGVGEAKLIVHGRSSHAGLGPGTRASMPSMNLPRRSPALKNGTTRVTASPSMPTSSMAAHAPMSSRTAPKPISTFAPGVSPICALWKRDLHG